MYAEVYLTLLTCCFSIDIYSFLYRTRVNIHFLYTFYLSGIFFAWTEDFRCTLFSAFLFKFLRLVGVNYLLYHSLSVIHVFLSRPNLNFMVYTFFRPFRPTNGLFSLIPVSKRWV
jgi:hypothetical protein